MQNTTRTTIRVQTELLNRSRFIALRQNTSIQNVINEVLILGFKHMSDIKGNENSFRKIDEFRNDMTNKNINLKKLQEASIKDQR